MPTTVSAVGEHAVVVAVTVAVPVSLPPLSAINRLVPIASVPASTFTVATLVVPALMNAVARPCSRRRRC